MKKTTLCFAAATLLISNITNIAAKAAPGDVIQPIYSTNILTYVDGIPIQGYSIDGKTMICLEDLADYGFSVYYNNEARALFVNKQRNADSSFTPTVERGVVGGIAGYTYETDIRAYINGQEIDAENIGGKLAVCVEELGNIEVSGTVRNLNFNYPAYLMRYEYNDITKSLYLFSDISDYNIYNTNITGFMKGINDSDGLFKITSEFENDLFTQYTVQGIYRDSSNYKGCDAVRFYKDGHTFNVENVLYEYDFIAYFMSNGISITDMSFSTDGKYLCFSGERGKSNPYSLMGEKIVYESGEYMLDMDTFALTKLNISSYE